MGWWDNLWLNEGFASWMQAKAAERLYPQWRTWLNGNGQKQFAMELDARRTSHPIQQPVANETEAMAAFDGITYSKGQALIRMLESYLGEQAFRDGIRKYMAAHAYGNTTTADLWQALEAASGKPVAAIAPPSPSRPGVPLVIAPGELRRRRAAHRAAAGALQHPRSQRAAPQHWQVPVAVAPLRAMRPAETVLLQGPQRDRRRPLRRTGQAQPRRHRLLPRRVRCARAARRWRNRCALMSPADRLNLIADGWALVEAGRAEPAILFRADRGGRQRRRSRGVGAGDPHLHLARSSCARPPGARRRCEGYARAKLRPVFDRLGWDAAGRQGDDSALLRTRLIRVLGELGDEEILAEARRRFDAFRQDRPRCGRRCATP